MLADHLHGSVAEHAFRAGVEDRDDALRIGRDDRDACRRLEHGFALRAGGGQHLFGAFALCDVVDEPFDVARPRLARDHMRIDLHPDRRAVFLFPLHFEVACVAARLVLIPHVDPLGRIEPQIAGIELQQFLD